MHCIFGSKNFRFPFSTKKRLNLGSEMEKNKVHKIVRNLLDRLQKLYMNGTVI